MNGSEPPVEQVAKVEYEELVTDVVSRMRHRLDTDPLIWAAIAERGFSDLVNKGQAYHELHIWRVYIGHNGKRCFAPDIPILTNLFEECWCLTQGAEAAKETVYRQIFGEARWRLAGDMLYPLSSVNRLGVKQLIAELEALHDERLPVVEDIYEPGKLNALLVPLTDIQRETLIQRFGLHNGQGLTYAQAARVLGSTPSCVYNAGRIGLETFRRAFIRDSALRQWRLATTEKERKAVPVAVLDIPMSLWRVLGREEITTIGALLAKVTRHNSRGIPGLAKSRLDDIQAALEELGLSLAG